MVPQTLLPIGWENTFRWDGQTYDYIVRGMYVSITDVDNNERSFTVKFFDHEYTFAPANISALINVPVTPVEIGPNPVSESMTEATILLCRENLP